MIDVIDFSIQRKLNIMVNKIKVQKILQQDNQEKKEKELREIMLGIMGFNFLNTNNILNRQKKKTIIVHENSESRLDKVMEVRQSSSKMINPDASVLSSIQKPKKDNDFPQSIYTE